MSPRDSHLAMEASIKARRVVPLICLAGVLVWAQFVGAAVAIGDWSPLCQGIDFATGAADTNEARLQRAFALRVDLTQPTTRLFSTPSNGPEPRETLGQTTTTFVETYGATAGVNANFFSPVSILPEDPRDLRGLAVSRGQLVSEHEARFPAILVTRSNQVTLTTNAPAKLNDIWTAVAGSDLVLINGIPQCADRTNSLSPRNPRTAIGLSQDQRYLFLMVIDGRQKGWSMGATLVETGRWLARFGAWNGLNLDGGGSSAMAVRTNGTTVLLNRPSGGIQRVNGNHLGVLAPPIKTPGSSDERADLDEGED